MTPRQAPWEPVSVTTKLLVITVSSHHHSEREPEENHGSQRDPHPPSQPTFQRQAPEPIFILTASASAFSLETLPPATTDSKAVTQRCLSGKLGASK